MDMDIDADESDSGLKWSQIKEVISKHKSSHAVSFKWFGPHVTEDQTHSFAGFLRAQKGVVHFVESLYDKTTDQYGVHGVFVADVTNQIESVNLLKVYMELWWKELQNQKGPIDEARLSNE